MKKAKGVISIKFQFMIIFFLIMTTALSVTFYVSYSSAKTQVLDVGGEMFSDVLKDTIGLMDAMNEQVKKGKITLEEAQEIVKTYVNGPKQSDGSRDITKTKMSVNDYMYVWGSHPDGTFVMHPFALEGQDLINYNIDGKYTVKDSWSNKNKTGMVFRELWQNPGEPVYTFIAYQG